MKSIAVTELRQRTAEVLDEVRSSEEPVAVIQRSQVAAYLVGAEHFDTVMTDLATARRELFLREVHEAEAEYAAGAAQTFEDIEALARDLAR